MRNRKKLMKQTRKNHMMILKKKPMILYQMAVIGMTVGGMTAFASGDPVAVINNLSTFIFSVIRAIGMILLGFGIVQVGLSLKSHDPSQRANGFLTLAGGVIITFAKEILNMIVG
ncbi:MAG: glutamyl-tRNA amidotransferase [Blautia sp.]|nr:glutamyl-tRNA amidotransferase [Blautia sp.]